jgi:hypothetical protein
VSKVQHWVHPRGDALPDDDPHFLRGDWRDAEILTPPAAWGGRLLRYTIVHWVAAVPALVPGAYDIRCRSIDLNGVAQPMSRPFAKGGRAEIQTLPLAVER